MASPPDRLRQLVLLRAGEVTRDATQAGRGSGLDGGCRLYRPMQDRLCCGGWRQGPRVRGGGAISLVAALLRSRSRLGSAAVQRLSHPQLMSGRPVHGGAGAARNFNNGWSAAHTSHQYVPALPFGLIHGVHRLKPLSGMCSVSQPCGLQPQQQFQSHAYSASASTSLQRRKQSNAVDGGLNMEKGSAGSPAGAEKLGSAAARSHSRQAPPPPPPPPPPPSHHVPLHHSGLNSEQLVAVKDVSADLVSVSAGPGSGKTRTLVARVLELVQVHGVAPKQIAVLTFTRKAADELRKRLRDALGAAAAEEVVLGTFHSLSARLLRQHFQLVDRGEGAAGGSRLAGLRKDFRVLEEDERSALIIRCLRDSEKALGMRHDRTRVRRFKELVSYVKNRTQTTQGLAPQQLLAVLGELAPHHSGLADMVAAHVTAHGPLLAAAPLPSASSHGAPGAGAPSAAPGRSELHLFLACLHAYDGALAGHGAADFDDLVGLAVALMQQPAARRAAAASFRHILVDEFQDTNLPQYSLVQQLRSAGASLFVVGDANQSIYTWRGALPDMASVAAVATGGRGQSSAASSGQPGTSMGKLDMQGAIVGPGAPDDAVASPTAVQPTTSAAASCAHAGHPDLVCPVASGYEAGMSAAGGSTPATTALYLRRNHRSLPHIVAVAERLINQQQDLHSTAGLPPTRLEFVRAPQPGAAVAVVTTDSARDEARWVVRQIQAITGHGQGGAAEGAGAADGTTGPPSAPVYGLGDVAILFRVNRQARYLEEALQEAGLPYCLPKSQPFWAGEQVRDVAAFLHLAARPLEVTGAIAASLLTRPARGVPGGSSVLSRLRRPSVRLGPSVTSATMGRLLFGDMVVPQGHGQAQEEHAALEGHGRSGGRMETSGTPLLLRYPQPDVAAAAARGAEAAVLVDPAEPPPGLAQAVADAMQLLVPPPSQQQERWRAQPPARTGSEGCLDVGGRRGGGAHTHIHDTSSSGNGSGSGSASSSMSGGKAGSIFTFTSGASSPACQPDAPQAAAQPRYMPLPASALRRKLAFTDLDADDPPWMLIVDNEAFPAPLAPPLPDEVCQALGIRPGDAEHDGITFLRDLVVLLQVAPHLGFAPQELVDAVVRATGYETWLEMEQGDRRDLSAEVSRLTELRQAAEQYGWDYRAAVVAAAAETGATARVSAGALPTVVEFSDHIRQLVEAAAQSGRGGSIQNSTHKSRPSKGTGTKGSTTSLVSDAAGHKKQRDRAVAATSAAGALDAAGGDCVRLLTLHGSKGLEFPVVFMTGCEDGLLPHSTSRNNPVQHQEERRLLFVGITRAMDQLYLTWAATRAAHRHRLLLSHTAAPGHLVTGTWRAAHERMPYMSPFVTRLLQELHAEGLVVEATLRPDGGVVVPPAHAAAVVSAAARQVATAGAPPPLEPLVAYHDATKARNIPLASLVMKR